MRAWRGERRGYKEGPWLGRGERHELRSGWPHGGGRGAWRADERRLSRKALSEQARLTRLTSGHMRSNEEPA